MSQSSVVRKAIEQLTENPEADAQFLNWVADRFVHVHGEKENVDYVLHLRSMARAFKHLAPKEPMMMENSDVSAAKQRVEQHMRLKYGVSLDDLDITDTPGYWQDRAPRMHRGHPLHGCVGNHGPFKATYSYFDPVRRNGRFSSRFMSWQLIKND